MIDHLKTGSFILKTNSSKQLSPSKETGEATSIFQVLEAWERKQLYSEFRCPQFEAFSDSGFSQVALWLQSSWLYFVKFLSVADPLRCSIIRNVTPKSVSVLH
jgi:hypothetical protein